MREAELPSPVSGFFLPFSPQFIMPRPGLSQGKAWKANTLICGWWEVKGKKEKENEQKRKKKKKKVLEPFSATSGMGKKRVSDAETTISDGEMGPRQPVHKVINTHACGMIPAGLFLFGLPNSALIALSVFSFLAFHLSLMAVPYLQKALLFIEL